MQITTPQGIVTIRQATEADRALPAYRYTLLNEVATCPTLAALTFINGIENEERAEVVGSQRSMALDAGSACHEVFAAVRLHGLFNTDPEAVPGEGLRLFGEERFTKMLLQAEKFAGEGESQARRAFCLEALYTSGFYDDPYDKNRTLANLEQVCTAYIDRWNYERAVAQMPDGKYGIEIKFDLVIEFPGKLIAVNTDTGQTIVGEPFKCRFVGTLDGLHSAIDDSGRFVVHENKTGRYINDAWAKGFIMSHQVTGYCAAATVMSGTPVTEALIFGSQIPLQAILPVRTEVVSREPQHFVQWLTWFRWGVDMFESAKADPAAAPKFTHSCGRFFGECKFIPFCAGDAEAKEFMLNNLSQGERYVRQ